MVTPMTVIPVLLHIEVEPQTIYFELSLIGVLAAVVWIMVCEQPHVPPTEINTMAIRAKGKKVKCPRVTKEIRLK